MIAPERLFLPQKKADLRQAVQRRFSCHVFSAPPSLADWASLSYLAGRYGSSDGVTLHLFRVPTSFFSGSFLSFSRITGTNAVCAVTAPANGLQDTQAGLLSEAFVLECALLGLGTCYLTGSFLRKPLPAAFSRTERVLCLIAIGQCGESPASRGKHKELNKLCQGDPDTWPVPFRQAASLVQLAPSSGGAQPFLMWADGNAFCLDSSDRTRMDLGIGICHAELALTMPHIWRFSEHRYEPMSRSLCQMEASAL